MRVAAGEFVQYARLLGAPYEEQDEGVGVQDAGRLVGEGRGVFAGVAAVGAGAGGDEVAVAGEEGDAGVVGGGREGLGHVAGEEGREVGWVGDGRVEEAAFELGDLLGAKEVNFGEGTVVGQQLCFKFRGDGERAGSEPPARGRISGCWS